MSSRTSTRGWYFVQADEASKGRYVGFNGKRKVDTKMTHIRKEWNIPALETNIVEHGSQLHFWELSDGKIRVICDLRTGLMDREVREKTGTWYPAPDVHKGIYVSLKNPRSRLILHLYIDVNDWKREDDLYVPASWCYKLRLFLPKDEEADLQYFEQDLEAFTTALGWLKDMMGLPATHFIQRRQKKPSTVAVKIEEGIYHIPTAGYFQMLRESLPKDLAAKFKAWKTKTQKQLDA